MTSPLVLATGSVVEVMPPPLPPLQMAPLEATNVPIMLVSGPQGPQGLNPGSQPRILLIDSSPAPVVDVSLYDIVEITDLAVPIVSMSTGLTASIAGFPHDGQKLLYRIRDNGTPQTIVWGPSFINSGVSSLLPYTLALRRHMVGFIYDTSVPAWVCIAVDPTGY